MALRNAIMATLADGESSGYDLSKRFDVGVANFWSATRQQLYRELEKMEAEGLIAARVVEQPRRPTKRVFSLTDAGRQAVVDFTRLDPKPSAIRDELLVQVEAVALGDAQHVRNNILAKRAAAEAKLAAYQQTLERMRSGKTEEEYLAVGPRIGSYLTLLRGIYFEQENLRWCDLAAEVLASRSPEDGLPTR
jgi:DNA-binding PadR family transcriptional regulator